jgi:hypothetical protein
MRSQRLLSLAILTLALAVGATGNAQVLMQPAAPTVTYVSPTTTYVTPYVTRFAAQAPTWVSPGPTFMGRAPMYVAPRYLAPYASLRPTVMAPQYSYRPWMNNRPWITGRPAFSTGMRSAVRYGPVTTF